MTVQVKIDSNATGLRYGEESSIGTIGTPTWYPLEPNEYDSFGGEITTVARNPINDGRQRKKGVTTDLEAQAGFTTDLTQTNLEDLMQGFFWADYREMGREVVTAVDEDTSNPDEYEVAATAGFIVGSQIKGFLFDNAANNDENTVTAITSNVSVEVATGQLVAETPSDAAANIRVIGHVFAPNDATAFYITASAGFPTLITDLLPNGWITDYALAVGDWVYIGSDAADTSFFNAENNGFKRIIAVTETTLTFDKSQSDMVSDDGSDDGAAGNFDLNIHVYFARIQKNLTGSSITRRSYHLERSLGAPDDSSPSQIQYEYVQGAVPNECTFNIPSADKITCDLSFMGTTQATVDGPTSALGGSDRPAITESDAFNTSSDVVRTRLATYSTTDEAPTALFTYAEEISISINNNLNALKAVGTLGAFDITGGTFEIGGDITAYFADVDSIDAVQNNTDVTLDIVLTRANAGLVIDVPLMSLGDGLLEVEQDEAIKVPLSVIAGSGIKLNDDLDHTLLIAWFDYLPTVAETVL